jgi:hypothetical protein
MFQLGKTHVGLAMKLCFGILSWVIVAALSAPATASGVEEFAFVGATPMQFLKYLKDNHENMTYTVSEPVENWVREEHLPALVALLASRDACMAVVLAPSSRLRLGSTIGDEAAFLIAGFRAKKYPATLHSEPIAASERARIRAWWKTFSARKK